MDLEQIKSFISKNSAIAYPAIGLIVVVVFTLLIVPDKSGNNKKSVKVKNGGIGIAVGGVDQQAYLEKIEKNYFDFEARVKAMEQQLDGMKVFDLEMRRQQKEISKLMARLEDKLIVKMDERLSGLELNPLNNQASQSMELAIAEINPRDNSYASVYLPLGSFCKGRLLTGVYAAADMNNPLPVLISLEEAFYGPNKTRIPLKGAFVMGKAYGDLNSQRALVQIVAISTVLSTGQTFEHQENLGYLTDEYGELGIKGKIIHNTGKQLALAFMGGFTAGGAQAIANDGVTTTTGYGLTSRESNGNAGTTAIFSGLAKSAGQLSEYYEKQAESLIPAIHIANGAIVYFITQKGISIDGLPRADRYSNTVLN